jgi:dipeptide/tripeptide permease
LIKPCIVGTVERTSKPDYRALGFSIYYALVNLGGAVGPIIASFVRSGFGIEYVFVMSAATSAMLIAGTLLFFREPGSAAGAGPPRTFGRLFRDMLLVFGNLRFMSFLVIFSGFYIMFWQIFYSLPFYVDEVLHYSRFEVLETVDAWTIILLSVPLTAFAKKIPAIQAMTLGFLISSGSWLILAASHTIPATIAGLFLFAAGESILAPRLYDYVGLIAPREQLGTFMGFAFLPVAIGSIVAGWLAGWLVEHYMRQGGGVTMMWVIVSIVGFVCTALMLVYDRTVKHSGAP